MKARTKVANIQERRNKDGKLISFSIRVFRGRGVDGKQLKPYTTTFTVPEKPPAAGHFAHNNKCNL